MVEINHEKILQALKTVKDPDLQRDLVSLNMIRDLQVQSSGDVSLRVVLTTPACPLKAQIESDVRQALQSVSGVKNIQIQMDSEVRARVHPQASAIPGVKNIIAVSSGKGGVGKSTVAVNLAMSLALEGARVGLMDADIYGPNIPTMMGVRSQPMMTEDPSRGEMLVPPVGHHNIKVMSMGFLVEGDQPLVWRGPMLHSVINQFCHKVNWGELDYLIVDMPPGTGDVQLSMAQLVPVSGAVLVTTPQEVSMQDVRKAFNMFKQVKVPVIGIVENMSYFVCDQCEKKHYLFGENGGKQLAQKFETQLLGQIPLLTQVREGGDEGTPIVMKAPLSASAQVLREMGRKIAQQIAIQTNSTFDV